MAFFCINIHQNNTQHNDIHPNNTQHNDIHQNNTQHNDIQQNDTQNNDIHQNDTRHNDIHQNDTQRFYTVIIPLPLAWAPWARSTNRGWVNEPHPCQYRQES